MPQIKSAKKRVIIAELRREKNAAAKSAVKTAIKTGVNDGTSVQILSGVAANDQILFTAKVSDTNLGFGGGNSPMGNGSSTAGEN